MAVAPRANGTLAKQKPSRCTAANVLQLLLTATLVLFAVSIFVTLHLTTTTHENSLESSRKLRKERKPIAQKSNKDGAKIVVESMSEYTAGTTGDQDLLQWVKDRRKEDKTTSLSQLLTTPLYYSPGTLPLSQLLTFQHCYTDPSIYSNHLSSGGPKRRVPVSEKHKLALVLLPKSGSSTGRYMMKHEFEAEERYVTLDPPLNVIAFVREPLSRFMSSYDEAFVRTAPWQKSDNPYYFNPETKKFSQQPHPFPYLFENMHSYHDYEDTFCPPSTRNNPDSRRECIDKKSAENGTLTHRLERFVREYSGRDPFDIHLNFQVPLLSNRDGYPMYLTELHNTTNAEGDWTAIAKRYLGEDYEFKNKGGVIEGRSYPRRFNSKLVSAETQKRICELALIDYCCLNFPLPSVCEGGDKKLLCKMDYDEAQKRVRVQPGSFPDKEN